MFSLQLAHVKTHHILVVTVYKKLQVNQKTK